MNRQEFDLIGRSTTHIHQDLNEFWQFIELANERRHQNILEIGSAHGGTLLFWKELGTNVISLDINKLEGDIPMERFEGVHFITADSSSPDALQAVKDRMPEIDILFIDGAHHYAGVKSDWDMYSSLVKSGGLVGFHDTAYGRLRDPDSDIESGKVFEEIEGYVKEEIFIYNSHGIGVVHIPE